SSRSLPSVRRFCRVCWNSGAVPVAREPALAELVVPHADHPPSIGQGDPHLFEIEAVLGGRRRLGRRCLGRRIAELGLDGTASGECECGEQDDARSAGDAPAHRTAFRYTAWPSVFRDRKSTRLNSSHVSISYAVFCLKKK